MKGHLAILCLLLACPAASAQADPQPAPAAKSPESLLAADSLVYVRYDGYERHRAAYDKTALAKVMKDDLGDFCEYVAAFLVRQFSLEVRLAAGRDPDEERRNQEKITAQMKGLTDYLWRHGVAIGLEVPHGRRGEHLPHIYFPFHGFSVGGAQLTVVFPGGATKRERDALLAFLHTAATLGGGEVKERKQHGRTIYECGDPSFRAAWWQEGEHVVCYLGTEPVERAVDVIEQRRKNIAATTLLRATADFKGYETDIRGYVDLEKVVHLWRLPNLKAGRKEMLKETFVRSAVMTQLGLTGLKNLIFHLGFDGQYQRSTVILNVAESAKRTGLLRLVTGPLDFKAENLPPLPPDAAAVSVRHVDWDTTYKVIHGLFKLAEVGTALRENR
jgi:hypothetical protein